MQFSHCNRVSVSLRLLAAKVFFLACSRARLSPSVSSESMPCFARAHSRNRPPHTRENMKRKRASKSALDMHCGEIHADDGVDPAEFFPSKRHRNNDRRRASSFATRSRTR